MLDGDEVMKWAWVYPSARLLVNSQNKKNKILTITDKRANGQAECRVN
jgi:hypothetical protein